MSAKKELEFIKRVLSLSHNSDIDDGLGWYENEKGKIEFYINCNDFFCWACSDCEEIVSNEDVDLLEKCIEDCYNIIGRNWTGPLLYCSRKRKMRPQGPYYSYIDEKLWPLFNEAGPEREIGLGNPCAPGEYTQPSARKKKETFLQKLLFWK